MWPEMACEGECRIVWGGFSVGKRCRSAPELNNWWQITPSTHFTRKSAPQLPCSGKSALLLTFPLTFNIPFITPLLQWTRPIMNPSSAPTVIVVPTKIIRIRVRVIILIRPLIRVRKRNTISGFERERDHANSNNHPERGLGLNLDASGDDDDKDSEGGGGILPSASSTLQGLLRKLEGEEGRQVEALTQLCEMLSIGTEDSLSTFSVDSFVPVLVGLLNHESNPDIMLLAARALTHLCDVLPSSCAAVVHYNAVSCFCARLLTIEYMDLAEQQTQIWVCLKSSCPKKWINSACESRHPQDSLDKHMVDLEMNLQMVSEEIAASLEEQSASALLRVPRATLDVLRLRDDAISLRNSIAGILDKLKKAIGSSAESIAALAKVDTVKQRMEAAYETLQDVAGLTQWKSGF
ncbi:hypothetical protein SLEP1_g23254 [Rubroshorea leprosula]|uniref:HECT-type E3 ubiquitin transferase n=1 Tax=Rubroshorea leprosula TaxID=152421 RepID=A0AAV5JLB0_9ROSI|nr:hypothetical protein SLEP1_g23254 [Rubroshorea leprosula]